MRKEEALEQIRKLIEEMNPILIKANIKFFVHEKAKDLKAEWIHEAFQWIENFYVQAYKPAWKVRILCSEEIWERMKLRGETDLREVRMWGKAVSDMRTLAYAKDRPVFFRRDIVSGVINKKNKKGYPKQPKDAGESDCGNDANTNDSPADDRQAE